MSTEKVSRIMRRVCIEIVSVDGVEKTFDTNRVLQMKKAKKIERKYCIDK